MNILKKLSTEGVLMSIRGAKGGYALARDPKRLTLAELIKVLEGPVALVDCCCPPEMLKDALVNCKTSGTCPVRNPLHALHERLTNYLETVTISDLCRKREGATEIRVKLTESVA